MVVWQTTKDLDVKPTLLPLLKDGDLQIRMWTVGLLSQMADEAPEVFEIVAPYAVDPDVRMRGMVLSMMPYFGKRGLPILQRGLLDVDHWRIRWSAMWTVARMGKEAEPLLPIMLALQNDPEAEIRKELPEALFQMDPKRFPKSANPDN